MDLYSSVQWYEMNLEEQHGEDSTHRDKEFKEARDIVTLGTGSATMGNGEYDTTLDMSDIWDRL